MRSGVVAAGFPRSATTVIPNAADIEMFRERDTEGAALRASLPWLGDRPLVLYAGTLGRVNGVDYLARVAGAMRHLDPEVRFLVVGHGAEESRVRATASSLDVLDETFHMMSPRPKSEMAALLSAGTIATNLVDASTGLTGESANKMFDAMAAGRPVAVNWPGRLPAELEQVGAGLLLDSDPDRAGKRLVTALRDPAWLARARASSARLADERYSRDLLFDRFEEVLLEAHAEGRIVRRLRPREVAGV
jgi:glycosyltransferase involved in cell wall biosynthesis